MVIFNTKEWSYLSCNSDCNRLIKSHYGQYEECVQRHHWKILLAGLAFLGLCWLGFKSMDFERDLIKLWIYNSSRLHNETSYISQHSSNHIEGGSTETIIQVTKEDILSPSFLLEHLQLLSIIVKLEVKYDHRVFTLQSFCRQIQLPRMQYLDQHTRVNIENIMPCEIVSPLNCFWEGSQLLNTEYRIDTSTDYNYSSKKFDWSTFDFQFFLNTFKGSSYEEFFVTLLNETGIGRGYITKPCIDLTNSECPNKDRNPVNLSKVLKNGCYQLAKNLYNYPRTVLVGEHNRALQSLIFLRSAADVLQTMKITNLDWTEEKVQHVITLWQSKLRQNVIQYNKQRPYLKSNLYNNIRFQSKRTERSNFYTFTNTSLSAALDNTNADETMMARYLISGGLVILFTSILFLSSNNPVRSHCWLAITGTVLVMVAIVAGLGLSAAIGLKFSVLTVQVIPFIMLGLGIDDVLILTGCYSRCMEDYFAGNLSVHPVYQTLYNCATVLLLSFLVKITIVGGITFVPVPLMRNFCEQVLLIIVFQTGTTVLLYPCLLYLDSIRQRYRRVDILCCLVKHLPLDQTTDEQIPLPRYDMSSSSRSEITSSQVIFSTEFTTSPETLVPDNVRQYVEINPISSMISQSRATSRQMIRVPDNKLCISQQSQCCWKFRYRFSKTFLHIIALVPVHVAIILLTVVIIVLGVYSAINVNYGLNFESIFIRDSNEYNYVKHESTEFQLNNFYVLTKEIDYTNYQELLLQLNDNIKAVTNVEIFGNGKFWLSSLIRWLERLQIDLDSDMRHKLILPNGTWFMNASKNGLMAMTLLVQDHDSINYRKLGMARLVHSHLVDQTNFYLYLNVWRSVSYDYDAIPCILYPQIQPFNMDNFIPNPERIEPSIIRMSGKNLFNNNPLQFVTCKYFHRGVSKRDELSLVRTIRTITKRYTSKGVASAPLGNVFSLSEQYFSLKYHLVIAVIISVAGVFLVCLVTMNHLLATVLICLILISSLSSPFFFINAYHLPLNGTSGVMALWSGGLGLRFSLFVIVSYAEHSGSDSPDLTANIADQNCYSHIAIGKQLRTRMWRAINISPCGSVLFSTLLSSAFISMSNVTYIWEHFLLLPLIGLVHSIFNCYCLTPILCFYILPQAQILSNVIDRPRLESRTPSSSSRSQSNFRQRKSRANLVNKYKFETDQTSEAGSKLSTIVEESGSVNSSTKSYVSQENVNQAPSSQSQESSQFIEQDIQSTLTMQYPCISIISDPKLSLQTSFKYRKPINSGT